MTNPTSDLPILTQALVDELIANAPRAFVGEPTHRGILFYRNASFGSTDSFRKVLLNRVGPYWVSEAGSVWYADEACRVFFNLPLIAHGEVVIRNGDKAIFELGELDPSVTELTGEAPRQWTPEEMTRFFLDHASSMARYWETVDIDAQRMPNVPETRQRLEGLLFSILALLDGSSANIPGFQLVSSAKSVDQEFNVSMGENYWPVYDVPDGVQLQWPLHELYSAARNSIPDGT